MAAPTLSLDVAAVDKAFNCALTAWIVRSVEPFGDLAEAGVWPMRRVAAGAVIGIVALLEIKVLAGAGEAVEALGRGLQRAGIDPAFYTALRVGDAWSWYRQVISIGTAIFNRTASKDIS
jgi:hypothetical protein